MRSLKDTIEYLEDQLAELKLENDKLYKENCELKEKLYYWTPIYSNFEKATLQKPATLVYTNGAGDIGKYLLRINNGNK